MPDNFEKKNEETKGDPQREMNQDLKHNMGQEVKGDQNRDIGEEKPYVERNKDLDVEEDEEE